MRRRRMRARCCWPITGRWYPGKTLTDAVYAAEELEEAAKLFLMLRHTAPRLLTPQQAEELLG